MSQLMLPQLTQQLTTCAVTTCLCLTPLVHYTGMVDFGACVPFSLSLGPVLSQQVLIGKDS